VLRCVRSHSPWQQSDSGASSFLTPQSGARHSCDSPRKRQKVEALAPEFHGSILSFNSPKQDRSALRLIKDLMVQASFSVEHRECGEIKAYVGDTRVSISCSCGAEIVRRLTS